MSCATCYYRKLCERGGLKPKMRRGKCERIAMYELSDAPFSEHNAYYKQKGMFYSAKPQFDPANRHDEDAQEVPEGFRR